MQGFAGRSTMVTGGAVSLSSGEGAVSTSGMVTIRSINAGDNGVSGVLVFSSGSASSGNSGQMRWLFPCHIPATAHRRSLAACIQHALEPMVSGYIQTKGASDDASGRNN